MLIYVLLCLILLEIGYIEIFNHSLALCNGNSLCYCWISCAAVFSFKHAQRWSFARGIEWSLRAFVSMRAVRLFLRARAVINFIMRAASTLEITNGEQRAVRNFFASWNLSLLKRFAPSNLADTFKTGRQVQQHVGNMIRPYYGSTIPSSLQPIMPC